VAAASTLFSLDHIGGRFTLPSSSIDIE